MTRKLTHTAKAVAHHTPGRTRLKVPKGQRHHINKIKESLEGAAGVQSVTVNHGSGSITVKHDHDMPIFETLHAAAETLGTDLLTTLIEGESAEVMAGVGIVTAGVGLLVTVGKAIFLGHNGDGPGSLKLPTLTGETSDLKTLVPVAFLAAAAYKAYETKSFWHGITPLALTWWAFDTYWRFNVANPTVFEPKNGQVHKQESQA